MMVQRVRNVLAYGTIPIIIYIDAVDLVRVVAKNLTTYFVITLVDVI